MDPLEQLMLLISSGGDPKNTGNSSASSIEMGTVGWDDAAEHFFPGDKDNDGHTLIAVQLYGGRDFSEPHKPDRAQGQKILCHVADGVFRVPVKGTRCYVALPAGMANVPGAGVIFATVSPGNEVKRNVLPGDTYIGATGGGQAAIIIKANGQISLMTTDDNTASGKLVVQTLGPKGLSFDSPIGSTKHDASGYHLKTKAGPRIDMGGINVPGLSDIPGIGDLIGLFSAYATITAPTIKLAGGSIFLGAGKIFNACLNALLKPPGVPPAGSPTPPPAQVVAFGDILQSQTVFVCP